MRSRTEGEEQGFGDEDNRGPRAVEPATATATARTEKNKETKRRDDANRDEGRWKTFHSLNEAIQAGNEKCTRRTARINKLSGKRSWFPGLVTPEKTRL